MLGISRFGLIVIVMAGLLMAGCNEEDSNSPADTNAPAVAPSGNPVVVIETSMGTMTVELYLDEAPISVVNFLKYTDEKFYDNTIFHRVMSGFMIQGGGFEMDMQKKDTHAMIQSEATNGLKNLRGTLAMARLPNGTDTASSQFFINHKDNAFLNHSDNSLKGYGYAVFGKVIAGEDVIDKIAAVRTGVVGGMPNVPVKPVVIKSIRLKIPAPTDARPVLE